MSGFIIIISVSPSSVWDTGFITSWGTDYTPITVLLINGLAINATWRIKLYNRLTLLRFIKQISGKAVT